jgi:hypothetical protein
LVAPVDTALGRYGISQLTESLDISTKRPLRDLQAACEFWT